MTTLPRRLSEPGPLLDYISHLHGIGQEAKVIELVNAVRDCLSTPSGAILLDLLEKSTLERVIPIQSDHCALDANNAQSFIALDLRRILSNELERKLEQISTISSTRGRRPKWG